MILNFLVPSTAHPVGGTMAIIEFANGMARRGHTVHLTHVVFQGRRATLDELDWCELDPQLEHHFPDHTHDETIVCRNRFDERDLPDADVVFCFDDRIPAKGRPFMWVQAYGILGSRLEQQILSAPCMKIATSRWLAELAGGEHLPYGVRHDKYRVTRPIAPRRLVAMLYNPHPVKGAKYGLDALADLDVDVVLFGTTWLRHPLPANAVYHENPDQESLVDIYNQASVFVSSSPQEGFGLAAVEAMACGAALVTADNGGSADYALDGETALVAPPGDAEAIAIRVKHLLDDDALRTRIADQGRRFVRRFDWDHSAALLEAIVT